ncbi:unnamed protein product [Arabis nemorensis]|uniref:HMA domain-containing protein n=1 Tax=Arabis nemorensis TaxID=586526 RepID=A0A565BZ66_9BRAS|nr:unnamed protein product [Arabis nemorensis]
MLKVEGVQSIKVNAKEGTIEVTSEIDPQVLIEMAAKAGKRAELLWDPEPESSENIPTPTPPKPESSENIPMPTPPKPESSESIPMPTAPPSLAMSSTDLASGCQVQVSSFDHTVYIQDLVDKKPRGIKHLEIIDKRVTKITFKEPHDDPGADHSRDSPSPIAPPSADSKGSGGGEANSSDHCGNVEVVAAPAEPPYSIPPEFSDAPCNSKLVEPPVAYVNCSSGGNRCRVM